MSSSAVGTRLRIGLVGLGRLGKRHGTNIAGRVPEGTVVAATSTS